MPLTSVLRGPCALESSTGRIDANPKEQFVYNMAGVAGSGGSSYIDSVIMRDRDASVNWELAADSVLEERVYYCQNWRADVISLFTDAGQLINQLRYDPYGVPFGISKADVNADGVVNTSDITRFGSIWNGESLRENKAKEGHGTGDTNTRLVVLLQ